MSRIGFASQENRKSSLHFPILIFFVSMLFTITLWDAYVNGSRPFDKDLASMLVLMMGTFFAVAAGLFSWSLEGRRQFLEREIEKRTQDLKSANEKLVLHNQEMENFIHIISHDLKAPLVSIEGFMSLAVQELGSQVKESVGHCFSRMSANVKQMNRLISDLLELSRLGRVEDPKSSVDIRLVLNEILDVLKPEIDKRRIAVVVNETFPHLWGSKKRLEQVFTNLISNAVKYIGTTAEPKIEIGCEQGDKNSLCRLWVKDNGIGIKKEFFEKVFHVFQRGPDVQGIEGTGVGLSIVKKIVEQNGGTAWAESESGKGSKFFVTWPSSAENPISRKKAA